LKIDRIVVSDTSCSLYNGKSDVWTKEDFDNASMIVRDGCVWKVIFQHSLAGRLKICDMRRVRFCSRVTVLDKLKKISKTDRRISLCYIVKIATMYDVCQMKEAIV
jgi:hypothetical protein